MSWNLWWRFGDEWEAREGAIVSTLARLRPDVVGLQEVWADAHRSQAQVLADRRGLHAAFAAPSLPPPPRPPETPDQAGVELGVAVLSRWPIDEVRTHQLPSRHRTEPPVALAATVRHPDGPLHVMTAAVEWEPAFADDQLAQTRALARLVDDRSLDGPLPVLLAADLNAPPDAVEIRALTDVMVDTWVVGGGDPDAAMLRADDPDAPIDAWRQIDERIDYVLARSGTPAGRIRVRCAFTAGDAVDGVHPSDHRATVADLAL